MKNQTVFVTGAANGLGNSIARNLATQGYVIFATMRDSKGRNAAQAAQLRKFAAEHGGVIHIIDLDVTSEESVRRAVQAAIQLEGRIDVLINNAGIGGSGLTEAFATEQIQQTFDVNVFGVQRVLRAVLPSMRAQRNGLVINISSAMGRIVIPFAGAYTASKYALEALAETYRYELAPSGVDVVIVQPGGFASGYWSSMMEPSDSDIVRNYGSQADLSQQLWTGMSTMMQSEQAPDPKVVVDAIAGLMAMPTGTRPFRTVVDPATGGAGPTAINQVSEQVQKQLLEMFGLQTLLTVKTS